MAQDIFLIFFFHSSVFFKYQIHLILFYVKMENFVRVFSLFLYKNAVVFIYLYTFIYIFISFSFVVVPVNCANSAVTQVAGDWIK